MLCSLPKLSNAQKEGFFFWDSFPISMLCINTVCIVEVSWEFSFLTMRWMWIAILVVDSGAVLYTESIMDSNAL